MQVQNVCTYSPFIGSDREDNEAESTDKGRKPMVKGVSALAALRLHLKSHVMAPITAPGLRLS